MGISNFKIMNPYPDKPTMRVLEKNLLFNVDFKKWLSDSYVTVRINYDSKQIAIVKEKGSVPEAIKPKEQNKSNQMRINSKSLVGTIRKLFNVADENFTLHGTVHDDYIIFEKLS
ncbi:hypothetical protein ACE4Z8_03215 [Enterococcus avium]|uniref:hypothetical protein n=1 Tax=Enterococcus avium TaxID=33945 RepID=UPI00288D27B7|nr:hypothetical protein [Enterococcus avium]MDT2385485.1 hypothetical protein [Enterococcus avium]MDT2496650.1 hypothetical protein [Enterococcus avium]